MAKSVKLAYFFWFIGGYWGLHHLYLRRDRQAFTWWCLVAGYGAIGWFHDMTRIRRYVNEANMDEKEYEEQMTKVANETPKPKFSLTRLIAMVTFGNLLAWVIYRAIPEETIGGYSFLWLHILIPFGSALGVHTVGNLGHQEGSIKPALVGAYLPYLWYTYEDPHYYISSVSASLAFYWYTKWRLQRSPPRHICKRVATLTVCVLLYSSLWGSYLYFNFEITNERGETIKLRDAATNLFNSPLWKELTNTLSQIWQYYRVHGWTTLWSEVVTYMDPLGERSALHVLDLPSSATQEEITQRWRQLSRKYHPDKFKDPVEKAAAQEKFMEIKDAYDKISVINAKRKRQSSKLSDEL